MRRLAIAAAVIVLFGFGVLGWVGTRIYQEMPPIPDRVVSSDGTIVFDAGEIERGQNVWQSMGGMEVGSIWGHGSYVAPDWTADWLHRESGRSSSTPGPAPSAARPYRDLDVETQAALGARLQALMRANRYDAATRTLTVEPVRARSRSPRTPTTTRTCSATGAATTRSRAAPLDRSGAAARSWPHSSSGRRGRPPPSGPATRVTYTSNWPHEPLVGNRADAARPSCGPASASSCCWPASARMVWWYASRRREPLPPATVPADDPLLALVGHAVAARDRQVLLDRRRRAAPAADRHRRRHGALRRRGRRLLRHPARRRACPTP